MWAIRILSGPQAGQVFPLKVGRNLIGRSSHCTIKLDSQNISKEHASIEIDPQQNVSIIDNRSRNGTFVNGIQIQKVKLTKGNKIAFNDIYCDLIEMPKNAPSATHIRLPQSLTSTHSPSLVVAGSTALSPQGLSSPNQVQAAFQTQPPSPIYQQGPLVNYGMPQQQQQQAVNYGAQPESINQNIFDKVNRYLDDVMLPGVYRLTEIMEFKIVIALLLVGYAFVLTALSTIPMVAITSEGIQIESRRRALTIARSLANMNQQALLQEQENSLSTSLAELEEGVANAYIIRFSDGSVMAPASKIGSIPNIPFIEQARKEQREVVKQIDSSHIGVSVPISAYSSETGGFNVKALSVVIYDMGSLAVEDSRTISLFIQTLVLAILVGLVLYFFFYKLLEFPIMYLDKQVDLALKTKAQSTQPIKMEYPLFQSLATKINTLLSRISHVDENENRVTINKDIEASNIVQMVGYSCIGISKDYNIIAMNAAFESQVGVTESNLKNQPIGLLPDQALQKNLHELIDRASQDPGSIHQSELEFGGINNQLSCICGFDKSQPAYYVVSIIPLGQGG